MKTLDADGWTIISDETFTGSPKQPGADNHAHVIAENYTRFIRCFFDAAGAAEAIKGSNKHHVEFIDCRGTRGVEDVGDFVDCHFFHFIRFSFEGVAGKKTQDITAKGGCSNFVFEDCKGLLAIVLGNYTIYDGRSYTGIFQLWPTTPKTRNFAVFRSGNPLVRSFWAEHGTGECRRASIPLLFVAIFFLVRYRCFPEKGANAVKAS